jgi:ribosome-associated protein
MARDRIYPPGADPNADDEPDDDGRSHLTQGRGRSKRSREADAVHALVVQMAELPAHDLDVLGLGEDVREALDLARRLGSKKRERTGLRRQLLFVASLLRHEPPEHLARLHEILAQAPKNSPRELALQEVEMWRTRVLKRGNEAIEELMGTHPDADRQRLRQLARGARKTFDPAKKVEAARNKRATRELFAALREVIGV